MISAARPPSRRVGNGERPAEPGDRPAEPGDRCPHRRPFPVDFAGCPAHQPVSFVATDSLDRPLATSLTCRHLTSGEATRAAGAFYPRCGLGSDADRRRWLAMVTPARLEVMRALQEEFDAAMAGHRDGLVAAKAAVVQRPHAPERRELLERRVGEFLDSASTFLAARAARFEDVGLPVEPLGRLVEDMSWAWARTRSYPDVERRRQRLDAFAPAAQAFLRPVADAPWRMLQDGDGAYGASPVGEVLLDTGTVRVSRLTAAAGVSVSGEIDAANADRVSAALHTGLRGAGERHLDLSGLLFSAVAGMRAVVRVAQRIEPSGRLVVHGMPAHLQRAMPGSPAWWAEPSHPWVRHGATVEPSRTFIDPMAGGAAPLPEPPETAVPLRFTLDSLTDVRRLAARHAARAGLRAAQVADLTLAVNEAATNSVCHGGGVGTLRVWTDGGGVICEVRDAGQIIDPLADRIDPGDSLDAPRGLWLANQLCDVVQVRSSRDGTMVRLHLRRR